MHLSQRSKTILNVSVVAAAFTISACQVAAQNVTDQALAQSDREDVVVKQPVDSGVTQTLGPRIAEGIAEIQGLMRGGEDSEPDMERAKELLDELRDERYARMNDFERLRSSTSIQIIIYR